MPGKREKQQRLLLLQFTVLLEHCKYGMLKEALTRERRVAGIRDIKLSAQLHLHSDLTLAKGTGKVRM